MPVGPEIADPPTALAPGHHGPWPLIAGGDSQQRVRLVVLQVDIESGPVLLDERELQHQSLEFVSYLNPLDVGGLVQHLGGPGSHPVPTAEVTVQATPEALGLTHVQHSTLAVTELIGPGSIGDGARRWTLDHYLSVGSSPGSVTAQ